MTNTTSSGKKSTDNITNSTGLVEIGKRLREARRRMSLKQLAVAQHLKITQSYLSAMEKGRRNISDENLEMFSKLYKVSVHWILTGIEDDKDRDLKIAAAAFNKAMSDSQSLADLPNDILIAKMTVLSRIRERHPEYGNSFAYINELIEWLKYLRTDISICRNMSEERLLLSVNPEGYTDKELKEFIEKEKISFESIIEMARDYKDCLETLKKAFANNHSGFVPNLPY